MRVLGLDDTFSGRNVRAECPYSSLRSLALLAPNYERGENHKSLFVVHAYLALFYLVRQIPFIDQGRETFTNGFFRKGACLRIKKGFIGIKTLSCVSTFPACVFYRISEIAGGERDTCWRRKSVRHRFWFFVCFSPTSTFCLCSMSVGFLSCHHAGL